MSSNTNATAPGDSNVDLIVNIELISNVKPDSNGQVRTEDVKNAGESQGSEEKGKKSNKGKGKEKTGPLKRGNKGNFSRKELELLELWFGKYRLKEGKKKGFWGDFSKRDAKAKNAFIEKLKRWFSNRQTKENRVTQTPFAEWIAGLSKHHKLPRRQEAHKFYMTMDKHAAKVADAYRERYGTGRRMMSCEEEEEDGDSDSEGARKLPERKRLALTRRVAITAELFDKEEESVQKDVETKAISNEESNDNLVSKELQEEYWAEYEQVSEESCNSCPTTAEHNVACDWVPFYTGRRSSTLGQGGHRCRVDAVQLPFWKNPRKGAEIICGMVTGGVLQTMDGLLCEISVGGLWHEYSASGQSGLADFASKTSDAIASGSGQGCVVDEEPSDVLSREEKNIVQRSRPSLSEEEKGADEEAPSGDIPSLPKGVIMCDALAAELAIMDDAGRHKRMGELV
ncbi:hypothetical protein C8J56DRAFT_1038090 [Mycena floridula]|nr:hypothetical protein C8J56DRAFT_1038090 [Mycena floridula]